MKPIDYASYKEVLGVVQRTNVEDSYQDLMKKESEVLNTVNNVVKYYRDQDIHESEFVNQGLSIILQRFPLVLRDILNDIVKVASYKDFFHAVTKEDRLIFLGLSLIILALFLFFVESSKW